MTVLCWHKCVHIIIVYPFLQECVQWLSLVDETSLTWLRMWEISTGKSKRQDDAFMSVILSPLIQCALLLPIQHFTYFYTAIYQNSFIFSL